MPCGVKSAMFALHVRNVTRSAVPVAVPLGYLESQARMSEAEWKAVREECRQRYGAPWRNTAQPKSKFKTLPATSVATDDDDSGDNWRS